MQAINESPNPPEAFVSTAGKCFYGTKELDAKDAHPELDEDSQPMGMDFPAELVGQWEAAADGVDATRIRHVKLRIGVVLGKVERKSHLGRLWQIGRARGFLPIIRLPFCMGLGCVIGKGTQMLPWVHIDDMVGILLHVIDNKAYARTLQRGRAGHRRQPHLHHDVRGAAAAAGAVVGAGEPGASRSSAANARRSCCAASWCGRNGRWNRAMCSASRSCKPALADLVHVTI